MSIKMYLRLFSSLLLSLMTASLHPFSGASRCQKCAFGKELSGFCFSFGFEFLYMCLCLTHWKNLLVFYLLNQLYLLFWSRLAYFTIDELASILYLNLNYDFFLMLVSRGCMKGLNLTTLTLDYRHWAYKMISWTTGEWPLPSLIALSLFSWWCVKGNGSFGLKEICTLFSCWSTPSIEGASLCFQTSSGGRGTDHLWWLLLCVHFGFLIHTQWLGY